MHVTHTEQDRERARTARWLNLAAPGLGHFYTGATWRSFVIGLPFLMLTHAFLHLLPVAGVRLGNLALLYTWYWLAYQVGTQLELGRRLRTVTGQTMSGMLVLMVFLVVYLTPILSSVTILFGQRIGVVLVEDDNLFPLVRDGEWMMFQRQVEPQPGSLVVFERGDRLHAARVVGVPGDRVRVSKDELKVNGIVVARGRVGLLRLSPAAEPPRPLTCFREEIGDTSYLVFRSKDVVSLHEETVNLEAGQYYLLCDDRDSERCVDSRRIGLVEEEALVGTPSHVVASPVVARIGFPLYPRTTLSFTEEP